MPSPEWPLQAGIYSALTGDSALMELVTGVYDYVPDDGVLPYITIGDDQHAEGDGSLDCSMWETDATVHTWASNGRGRKEVKQIQSLIYDALHNASLAVTGFNNVKTRSVFSDVVQDPDGITYHGINRFDITVGE